MRHIIAAIIFGLTATVAHAQTAPAEPAFDIKVMESPCPEISEFYEFLGIVTIEILETEVFDLFITGDGVETVIGQAHVETVIVTICGWEFYHSTAEVVLNERADVLER